MRIAYICADNGIPLDGSKGASNHVREFVAALVKLGHEPAVFAARIGQPEPNLSYQTYVIGSTETFPVSLHPETAGVLRNESLVDALEAQHALRRFDIVYERYSLWSFGGLEFARANSLPFVLEVNSPLRREQMNFRTLHMRATAALVERCVFSGATLLAGVSSSVVDYAVRQSGRTGPSIVLPNGVDLDLFASCRPAGADEPFTIGFAGSLKPWHGLEVLLEAYRLLTAQSPDYRLLVVGDGPLREYIERETVSERLRGLVQITGALDKRRIPEALGRMHVAVAPYTPMDEFYFSPLKIYEYMAAGCAIVASRIGQVADVLSEGQTGLFAEPGNPAELARQISRLREDIPLRESLGRSARREAFACHSWTSRVTEVLQAVRENAHVD